jgi:hypothetical protein
MVSGFWRMHQTLLADVCMYAPASKHKRAARIGGSVVREGKGAGSPVYFILIHTALCVKPFIAYFHKVGRVCVAATAT